MTEFHETVRPTGSMNSEVLVREFLTYCPRRMGPFQRTSFSGALRWSLRDQPSCLCFRWEVSIFFHQCWTGLKCSFRQDPTSQGKDWGQKIIRWVPYRQRFSDFDWTDFDPSVQSHVALMAMDPYSLHGIHGLNIPVWSWSGRQCTLMLGIISIAECRGMLFFIHV